MKKQFLTVLAIAILFVLTPMGVQAQNEKVDNNTIVELLKTGFGTEEIITYLENASERDFHLDLSAMKELKAAGADTDLILYLQKMAKKDFGLDGFYWWNTGAKPKRLNFSALEAESKGMNGAFLGALTGVAGTVLTKGSRVGTTASVGAGAVLASSNFKADKLSLPGTRGKTIVKTNGEAPVFRMYLPKRTIMDGATDADVWYNQWMSTISSPNEFQIIKLVVKKNKRTLPNGMSWGVAGFTSKGTGAKDVVNFEINDITNNVFELTFPEGLAPGEYCFFFKDIKNKWFQQNAVAYDFSVE